MKANSYQIVVVLDSATEKKARESVLKSVATWISEAGAETKKPEDLGTKNLAYKIKGQNKGDFYVFEATSEAGLVLKDLNLALNRESTIIRYLILKK